MKVFPLTSIRASTYATGMPAAKAMAIVRAATISVLATSLGYASMPSACR